jgi:sugar phosphate isomerase/epimerase
MQSPVTRREFLERSALTAAALAAATRTAAARAGMFISLNGADAPGIGPWPAFAELASRIGYGGIDWSFAPVQEAGAAATRALLARLNLKPTIVNLPLQGPFTGDAASFKEKLGPLAEDAALAAEIGCRKMMMVLSPRSGLPKDEQRALVVDRMSAVADVLQKSNIRLGMEFLGPLYMHEAIPAPPAEPASGPAPSADAQGGRSGRGRGPSGPQYPFIWTMAETVALARDCGPNVGVVLDVWHWHHSGSTIADILAAGKDRVIHVHVSDAKPMAPEAVRDNMRVLPGEGSIDLVSFFQALQKIGYDGGVSPEPLGRFPRGTDPEEAARQAFDATQAVMKKAGV